MCEISLAFPPVTNSVADEGKMSSWGCPHEFNGICQKVNKLPCDPGMRGCVLYGRFVFSNPVKNRPPKPDTRAQDEEKRGQPRSSE